MAKFSEWLKEIDYKTVHGDASAIDVNEVVFDSRKVDDESVFVCMRGTTTDSHAFLPGVIEKGCSAIVIEEDVCDLPIDLNEIYDGIAVIKVDSAREALAKLSAARFGYPAREMTVIAITGTKGKTTTAHMVRSIIETAGEKVGIIGTNGIEYAGLHLDTKNTTPESYDLHKYFREMVNNGCKYLVMEASSQGFKMHRTDGIEFDYGLFTNIEPDHIGPNEHADFDEYKYYKSRIFAQSKHGLINMDADFAEELKDGAECPMVTWSLDAPADYKADKLRYVNTPEFVGVEFDMTHGGETIDVKLNLPGRFNVYNAMAAIAVADQMGIDRAAILDAMRHIKVAGRMETVFTNEDMTVIVDYAHNAMAMESLVKTLRHYEPKRLVVVFGCGGNRAKDRRYGMGETAAKTVDFSILTADNSRFEKTEDIIADIKSTLVPLGGKYIEIPDRRDAIRYAMEHAEHGDMIAVIGKGHEDYNEANGHRTHFLDSEEIKKIAEELFK